MKRGSVLLAVVASALLALTTGCSSSSKAAGPASSTTTAAGTGASGSSTTAGGSSAAKVDCTKVKAAGADLIVDPQKLAALRSADAYTLIQNGTVSYDPDQFASDLDALESLDGVDLGGLPHDESVADAIKAYRQANDEAKQALASSDPYNSSAGQQLAQQVSDTATFLGHQTVISEALTADHCS